MIFKRVFFLSFFIMSINSFDIALAMKRKLESEINQNILIPNEKKNKEDVVSIANPNYVLVNSDQDLETFPLGHWAKGNQLFPYPVMSPKYQVNPILFGKVYASSFKANQLIAEEDYRELPQFIKAHSTPLEFIGIITTECENIHVQKKQAVMESNSLDELHQDKNFQKESKWIEEMKSIHSEGKKLKDRLNYS